MAASAGLFLDDWQRFVLEGALGERDDGKWAAFEVGLIVPRQNGKGSVLEARELAGLFLFGEQLILHSAHEFKTAQEAFRRVLALVENTDHLRKRVARIRTSHGEEGIELIGGARLRFVARSTGSGRGFSGDCVILDESYNLSADSMAALLPTLSARPNPQLWYASSAGMDSSEQLARVRERGQVGAPGLAYFEWSAPADSDLDDAEAWAQANPALGIRIPQEFVERERAALPEAEFARERLGIWSDPRNGTLIQPEAWQALADPSASPADPVAFGVEVSPDGAWTSIGIAGRTSAGLPYVEVMESKRGTGWVVDRLVELQAKWRPLAITLNPGGPAGALLTGLAERGVEPLLPSARELGQACGEFFLAATETGLSHRGQPLLAVAVGAARKRKTGDAWVWQPANSKTDIAPLWAVTLALHAFLARSAAPTSRLTRTRGSAVHS